MRTIAHIAGVVLAASFTASADVTYTSDRGDDFHTSLCADNGYDVSPASTDAQKNCFYNEDILKAWPQYVSQGYRFCHWQRAVCNAKLEHNTDLTPGCVTMVKSCRSALRHLHAMMYTDNADDQVCNNFALKSVRGIFHDYMSSDVEGSVMNENHVHMNVGLCRWSQYVNVLSDATGCDAGSIIQMAGQLGFAACGFDMHQVDIASKPMVELNQGMSCSARTTGEYRFPKKTSHPLFDEAGQRLSKFDDVTVSASSQAQEDFWCTVNPVACATGDGNNGNGMSDGEAEYAGEATAIAHVIGRVTCPVGGQTLDGAHPTITPGFFHVPRSDEAQGTGMDALKARFKEGYQRLRETQCGSKTILGGPSSNDDVPTGGVRVSTAKWPLLPNETDLNVIGGLCGMPTQFLETVRIGNQHRVPRFFDFMHMKKRGGHGAPAAAHTDFQKERCEDKKILMYMPLELLTIKNVALPASPALDRFLAIAFDGVGTIDSAWDSCVVGCDIDVMQNRICGGPGLQDFKWPDYGDDNNDKKGGTGSNNPGEDNKGKQGQDNKDKQGGAGSNVNLGAAVAIPVVVIILLCAGGLVGFMWYRKQHASSQNARAGDSSTGDIGMHPMAVTRAPAYPAKPVKPTRQAPPSPMQRPPSPMRRPPSPM